MKQGLIFILFFLSCYSLLFQNNIVLENNKVKAVFDVKGSLIELVYKKPDWKVVYRHKLGQSFQMLVPIEGKDIPFIKERRFNNITGSIQSAPSINKTDSSVIFIWKSLNSDYYGALDISFSGKVILTEDGLQFSGTVENHSKFVVEYVSYPYFGEIAVPDKTNTFYLVSKNYTKDIFPGFGNEFGYWGVDYPTKLATLPNDGFLLFCNDRTGMYFSTHDANVSELLLGSLELIPGSDLPGRWAIADTLDGEEMRMQFKATHVLYVPAGKQARLNPVDIKFYQGNRYDGASIYSQILKNSPERTNRLDSSIIWRSVKISNAGQLVEYAKESIANGVSGLIIEGAYSAGSNSLAVPIANLKEAIAQCKRLGCHILLDCNFTFADSRSPYYKDHLKDLLITDPYGYPYDKNTLCPAAPAVRKMIETSFLFTYKQTGADGIICNDLSNNAPAFCFNPHHGHPVPQYVAPAMIQIEKEFNTVETSMLRYLNPETVTPDPQWNTNAASSLAGQSSTQHFQTFENNEIKAVINLDNGALESLQNKLTGWDIIKKGYGDSFQMEIIDKQGQHVVADGIKQKQPICEASQDSLVFIWNGIKLNDSNTTIDVTFKGIIKFSPSEGLIFYGQITNNSEFVIKHLIWPAIGNLAIPDENGSLFFRAVWYSVLHSQTIYPNKNFTQVGCRLPEQAFSLIENHKQGLYICSKDTAFKEYIQLFCTAIPTNCNYRIEAIRNVYIDPKETLEIVPVVLKPYEGDWYSGTDIYKAWRKKWYKAPHRPEWIKQVNAWQQLQINSSESRINFKFSDLVNYAKEAKRYGVNAIQLTGWTYGGQDRGLPLHDVDPRLGTLNEFKKAIADCQAMGVNIILFTKFTWVEYTSPQYDIFNKYICWDEDSALHFHGGYSYNTYTQLKKINNRRLGSLCQLEDSCRLLLCREFKKCLDLGAAGMVYDENYHHGGVQLCFNPNHKHKNPAFEFQGSNLLGRDFYEMTQQYSPDFLMAGEACYDAEALYYATYTRTDIFQDPVERYIDSELPVACAIIDHNDLNKINMCLLNRYAMCYEPRYFKGRLSEFPRNMAYGMKVDSLRRRYSDYLWTAEYINKKEAKVEGKDLLYSVFKRSDGKRAIVIMNYNTSKSSIAHLTLNDSGSLTMVSPEKQDERPFPDNVQIEPQRVIVVLEK